MAFQTVDFYINDTTPQKNPVSGVTVKILSTDGTIVYGLTTTDVNGHAGFLLPDSINYQARFFKFSVSFTNPQLFTVYPTPLQPGQSNAFNISAELVPPPVPNDPRLCTAFGFFRDITGAPQRNADIQFIARFDPTLVDGAGVLKERKRIRSDKYGYCQVNLFRNAHYDCTIAGEEDITRKIRVPDQPNVNLPDLIFPVVESVVTTPAGPFSISVGQELMIGLKVYASDGECLGSGITDVLYSTSNDNVLGFTIYRDGMTLIGVGPGTAQINMRRANRSIVRIPDCPIQGQPLVVVVTP
jgi:hypothetical protein